MPTQHYRADSYLARNSVGYLLKRAYLQLADRLEPPLEAQGFTFTQWVVLMHLRDGLALNARELCMQLRHDSGALTRVIDQLEGRGLVSRERSRRDRREVQLQLTALGRSTVEGTIPTVVEYLNHAFVEFTSEELATLTRLLTKLTMSLQGQGSGQARDEAAPIAVSHEADAAGSQR